MELTRQSVFNAIRDRQCYAASLERIIMHGSIAEHAFGQVLSFEDQPTPPTIDITIAAKSNILKVDVVRNGKTVHTTAPDSWETRLTYVDQEDWDKFKINSPHLNSFIYYYVRVTCESGAQAWSSPVWIVD
jgi:hypothetical protein